MATLHLGLTGYDHREWQGEGLFYPPGLSRLNYLEYYSRRMNSLQALSTYYKPPTDAVVARWINGTRAPFTVSPKMVRYVSDVKQLADGALFVAKNFLDPLYLLHKAEMLGPIFLDIPPAFERDNDRLDGFLTQMVAYKPFQWAVQFRNASWNHDETESLLRKHRVAWIAADEEPVQIRHTADFTFTHLCKREYTDAELVAWANRVKGWLAEGRDCFVYCRHKDTVEPWKWADRLRELIG